MAVDKGPKLDWGVLAGADLSAKQFTFVKFDGATDDEVIAVASVDDFALGVLNNAPEQGFEAEVVLTGVVKVKLGGTVARDDGIGAKADGTGIKAAAGKRVYGRALESGVSGQIISVALNSVTPTTAAA